MTNLKRVQEKTTGKNYQSFYLHIQIHTQSHTPTHNSSGAHTHTAHPVCVRPTSIMSVGVYLDVELEFPKIYSH